MHPVARKHLNTFLAMWLTVGSIVHVECQNAELISQRCTTRIVGVVVMQCGSHRCVLLEEFNLQSDLERLVKTVMPSCFGWTPQVGDQLLMSIENSPPVWKYQSYFVRLQHKISANLHS